MALAYNFTTSKDTDCNVSVTGLFTDATTPTVPTDSTGSITVNSVDQQLYVITELTGSRTETFCLYSATPTVSLTFSNCTFGTDFSALTATIATTNTQSVTTTITVDGTAITSDSTATTFDLVSLNGSNLAENEVVLFLFTVTTECGVDWTGTYTLTMPSACTGIPSSSVNAALTEGTSLTYATIATDGTITFNQNAFGITESDSPDTEISDGVWQIAVTTTYTDSDSASGTFDETHCIFVDCDLRCSLMGKVNTNVYKREYQTAAEDMMMYEAINYATSTDCDRCNQAADIYDVLSNRVNYANCRYC